MDVDTLVRHDLPVVMVMGNNSAWGLEKGPMQMLYGYDVVADLAPRTPYDEVVRALGGAGETVTDPRQIGPALDRAFAAGVPYLVNVITDVDGGLPAHHVRDLMARMRAAARPARGATPRSASSPSRRTPTSARRRRPLRRAAARRRRPRPRGRALGGRRTTADACSARHALPAGLAVARARPATTRASSGCSRSRPGAQGRGRRRGAGPAWPRPGPRARRARRS